MTDGLTTIAIRPKTRNRLAILREVGGYNSYDDMLNSELINSNHDDLIAEIRGGA